MDGSRFDKLARTLRRPGSRRGALGALALAAFAPLTGAARPEPAKCLAIGRRCTLPEAAPQAERHGKGKGNGKGKGKGKHHRPSCSKCCSRFGSAGSDGKARCSCKPEGEACDNASQCCGGLCRNGQCTRCPGDLTACNGACVDLQTDPKHCGAYDDGCDAGQRCGQGACVCDAASCPTGCCDGTACKRGTSGQACGESGELCQVCVEGQRCDGSGCVCDAINCSKGCCDATSHTCQGGDTDAGCGVGGATCQSCVGNDVAPDCVDGVCTCASGVFCSGSAPSCCPHAKDVCDQNEQCCTPTTCAAAGKECGTLDDGCGQTLDCGPCQPFGAACASNGACASGVCACLVPDCSTGGLCADAYQLPFDPTCNATGGAGAGVATPAGDAAVCARDSGQLGCPNSPCPAGQVCAPTSGCLILIDGAG